MSNSRRHIEDAVDLQLRNISEFDKHTGEFLPKLVQFRKHEFWNSYGTYFRADKIFKISDVEYNGACRALDEYIEKKYGEYTEIPREIYIKENLPSTIQPYWEILHMVNQNKWCKFFVLKKSIPEFEDIDIEIFVGSKARSPFDCDQSIRYNTINLKGKLQDIDNLMRDFRV